MGVSDLSACIRGVCVVIVCHRYTGQGICRFLTVRSGETSSWMDVVTLDVVIIL